MSTPAPIARIALPDFPVASDADLAAYERERELDRRRDRLDASGILEHLPSTVAARVARATLDPTQALDVARRWRVYQAGDRASGSKPLLALLGPMGCGKTVAAADLLAAEGGRYVQAEDLCRLHSARFGAERAEYLRTVRLGVLVVDEVGTEEDADRSRAMLHELVDRRLGRMTLVLGNVTRPALASRLDPRTLDRMRECAVVRELAGASMRQGAGW